ncbi:carboxypeptidase regulatory-like domain-containing protein [archaeon]|nr:carboxypeptidase regulatory-like domain-containing protein [archaeon]
MDKKRFLLAVLLLGIFLVTASQVLAGCCVGIIGCSRAFFESECSELATFVGSECEQNSACDIVACCHNITGIPKATYRATCMAMTPPPAYDYIKPFTTNPAAESAYANSICAGARPPCTYTNCEQPNTEGCICGSAPTSASSLYCCSRDSSVFASFGACSASVSCRGGLYAVHGRVIDTDGNGVPGAEVWGAGPNRPITDENGNYTLDLVKDGASVTVWARKEGATNNSGAIVISGADFFGLDIVLDITAGPVEGREDCSTPGDQDGDQFGWTSDAADRCDSDCLTVARTVTPTYYNPAGERYPDTGGRIHDLCSDRFDNDCDGQADCADEDCRLLSSACQLTSCGDGIVSFPNADGQYEQCDVNATGAGNDSLCPGKCIPADQPRECTCRYEAMCGNGVIDEPLEDCDGRFNAAVSRWDAGSYVTSGCTKEECGTPTSVRPCQCPPPQI